MKIHLGYLLGIAALSLAGCAAFFSIFGLSQLFAGASIAVIIMATSLEFSKIIIASYLHNYWSNISKIMRTYLCIGLTILVLITSAGIYGFLSNAFQKTANNLETHDGQIGIVQSKVSQFESKLDANNKIIDLKSRRLNQLSDVRALQENRIDLKNNTRATRSEIISATSEINSLNLEINQLTNVNSVLMDSIAKYNSDKIKLKTSSELSGEVGPLKYIANLTGTPMNVIVNYFILLLVFVFDPLAICLVIATNSVFKLNEEKNLKKNDDTNDDFLGVTIDGSDGQEEIIETDENTLSEQVQLTDIAVKIDETSLDQDMAKKIKREDIKEVKEMMNRGFTVNIPSNEKENRVIFGKHGRIK